MFDLANLATDKQKEVEGVWRPYKDGSELLIARVGNERYKKLLRKKAKSQRSLLDNDDDLAEQVGDKILAEVLAATILLDWKGVCINGNPIEYTVELGTQLLTDVENRDFREAVNNFANDAESYRKKREDEAAKN